MRMFSLQSLWLFVVSRIMTLSAFFGVIVFWLVSGGVVEAIYIHLHIPDSPRNFWIAVGVVAAVFAGLSRLSLWLAGRAFANGNTLNTTEIKPIENIAIPTYIGMFVIALEIGGSLDLRHSLAILVLLLVLWWLFERVFYFNPMWLFFGFRFYEAKTKKGNTFTVISARRNLKGACEFTDLRKINEYTYLEKQ